MNKKIKFSVIMPAYNSEQTIKRSIESVLNQYYFNFEIIVVNDGSTDSTPKVVNELIHTHGNCIKLISQINSKQGAARNNGLLHASGEYILFLDSDDELNPDLFNKLNSEITKTDSDIIFFGIERVNEDGYTIKKLPADRIVSENIKKINFEKFRVPLSPCGHICKREYLLKKNHFFLENVSFEDIDYMIRLVYYCPNASTIDYIGYKYYIYTQSTVRGSSANRNLDVIKSFDSIINFLKQESSFESHFEIIEYLAIKYLYIDSTIRIFGSKSRYTEKVKIFSFVKNYMNQNFENFNSNIYFNELDFNKKVIYKLIKNNNFRILNLIVKLV